MKNKGCAKFCKANKVYYGRCVNGKFFDTRLKNIIVFFFFFFFRFPSKMKILARGDQRNREVWRDRVKIQSETQILYLSI